MLVLSTSLHLPISSFMYIYLIYLLSIGGLSELEKNSLSEPSFADIKPNPFTTNAKIIWAHELVNCYMIK